MNDTLQCLCKTIWTGGAISQSMFSPDKIKLGSDFNFNIRVMDCKGKETVFADSNVSSCEIDILYGEVIIKESLQLLLDNITNRYYIIMSHEDFVVKGSYNIKTSICNTSGSLFFNDFYIEIT